MSIINNSIHYNQPPDLAWKLPVKRCTEIKCVKTISPPAPGETVTIELTDPRYTSLQNYIPTQIQLDDKATPCTYQLQEPTPYLLFKNNSVIVDSQNEVKEPKKEEKKGRKKGNRLPIDGTVYYFHQLGLKVPPKKSLGIRGKIIHKQAREVINNVFKFMKDEAQNGIKIPISNYRERVLRATGISKCTYSKITTREFQRGDPQPTRKPKCIRLENTVQVSENDSIYRPKINRDASTPDGVYNLEDLVEAYILDTLAVEAGHIMTVGNCEEYGLCPFALSNINKILLTNDSEEEKIRRITIFLYINYLIKFMTTPMKSITKKFVVCDKSIDINNHILNSFSETGQNGRTRPLHMKDKALCYTMILAAIAMDFEVDVELLSKDLKIGVKKAVEVARILAFNAKANNKHVVQLKLPLPAPITYTPKRRSR